MDVDLVGAIKVKDGLFIGDQYAGQDLEFVVANKVTHVINCAAGQVPNHWEPIGVRYLCFAWEDTENQVLFEEQAFQTACEFTETATLQGESVLMLSLKGIGRCCALSVAYVMRRYRWSCAKSLDFMRSRQPSMRLNPGFLRQLQGLETRMIRSGLGPKTRGWEEDPEDEEERLVTNTFRNAQALGFADYVSPVPGIKSQALKWADGNAGDPRLLEDIAHPSAKNPVELGCAVLKSCLKGSDRREVRIPLQMLKIRSQKILAQSDYANKTPGAALQAPAFEYGKTGSEEVGPRIIKKLPPRPNSASKRENSPLVSAREAPARASSAKRESPRKTAPAPDKKKPLVRDVPRLGMDTSLPKPPLPTTLKPYRPISTPQRQRTGEIPSKGPVKAQSTSQLKKSVWK